MTRSVKTLAEAEALDFAEVQDGYRDGRTGAPEPGDNRSLAYWHGWRVGASDGGFRDADAEQRAICREFVARGGDIA